MARKQLPVEQISKAAIRKRAQRAVSLTGATCSKCGSPNCLERHHPDYSQPTMVDVLCSSCHGLEHLELAQVACVICQTMFQPMRERRSVLCSNPACLSEMGRKSAAKRWKTEPTDCDKLAMASVRCKLHTQLSFLLGEQDS